MNAHRRPSEGDSAADVWWPRSLSFQPPHQYSSALRRLVSKELLLRQVGVVTGGMRVEVVLH